MMMMKRDVLKLGLLAAAMGMGIPGCGGGGDHKKAPTADSNKPTDKPTGTEPLELKISGMPTSGSAFDSVILTDMYPSSNDETDIRYYAMAMYRDDNKFCIIPLSRNKEKVYLTLPFNDSLGGMSSDKSVKIYIVKFKGDEPISVSNEYDVLISKIALDADELQPLAGSIYPLATLYVTALKAVFTKIQQDALSKIVGAYPPGTIPDPIADRGNTGIPVDKVFAGYFAKHQFKELGIDIKKYIKGNSVKALTVKAVDPFLNEFENSRIEDFFDIRSLTKDIADGARAKAGAMAKVGGTVLAAAGMIAAISGATAAAPVAVIGALALGVGVMAGLSQGFLYDNAAVFGGLDEPDKLSVKETARFYLESVAGYARSTIFGAIGLSTTEKIVFKPVYNQLTSQLPDKIANLTQAAVDQAIRTDLSNTSPSNRTAPYGGSDGSGLKPGGDGQRYKQTT